MADTYGRCRLEAASSRALNFGAPSYRTIKQILKDGLDQQPDLLDAVVLEAPYPGGGRFCRTPADRLHGGAPRWAYPSAIFARFHYDFQIFITLDDQVFQRDFDV